MSKANEIKDKETCSMDYKTEYKKLQEKNLCIQKENENKLKVNQEMWQQIVDDKDKEINWLKLVINRILHI